MIRCALFRKRLHLSWGYNTEWIWTDDTPQRRRLSRHPFMYLYQFNKLIVSYRFIALHSHPKVGI